MLLEGVVAAVILATVGALALVAAAGRWMVAAGWLP